MNNIYANGFHGSQDRIISAVRLNPALQKNFHHDLNIQYDFDSHFHPYVGELIERLISDSVAGLQAADTEYKEPGIQKDKPQSEDFALYEEYFKKYDPKSNMVNPDHPVKEIEFHSRGAYSVYNWELFYHVPLTVGMHLSQNQRYADAQKWLHYIFDPTDDSDGPTPERFWKVKPFQTTVVRRLEEIITILTKDPKNLNSSDRKLQDTTIDSIKALNDDPFRPHVVARYRQTAYMYKAVMAYLDNLIAWGDSLFRRDTGESVNEAMQHYITCANILGPKPQLVPKKATVESKTYDALRKKTITFGNALVEIETELPFNLLGTAGPTNAQKSSAITRSIGTTLYFCIPRNEKILGYWTTTADRLFKLRNSLNLQGVFRQLPLFEAPIDPAMLVRAAASGLDISAIMSGLNQPLPHVRFSVIVQKALRITQEVKSLGSQLLAAIEKEDNEALTLLRAQHESAILKLTETVRYAQWQESIKAREGLEIALLNAIDNYTHYEKLLGTEGEDIEKIIPELDSIEVENLEKLKFKAKEKAVLKRDIEINIDDTDEGGQNLNSYEVNEMRQLEAARGLQVGAAVYDIIGSGLSLIPQIDAKGQPMGVGVGVGFGGVQLSKMYSMMASAIRIGADQLSYEAAKTAKIGGYSRREEEWELKSNNAAGEISQTLKQLRAAQIREYSAKHEFEIHQKRIVHASEVSDFLEGEKVSIGPKKHSKTSTQDLYTWMRRESKGLYAKCYQLAFDTAKQAERALQHELGNDSIRYLEFNYMEGKEGLFAGEKLSLDILRMEMDYDKLKQDEKNLIRHVSLRRLDPVALLTLRATGKCTVGIPETYFDLGGAGEYFRRIKTVALSIPSVTGPYTSINCTLRLHRSSIRTTPNIDSQYEKTGSEDARFNDHMGHIESIVTSHGQNDSGLFETNLNGERRLPFEGSGVISTWQLELPGDPSKNEALQFDYDTIGDIILHFRYTAREGGELLKKDAKKLLNEKIKDAEAYGSVHLISLRHDMPDLWNKFTSSVIDNNSPTTTLDVKIESHHLPYWIQGDARPIKSIELFSAPPTEGPDLEISFMDKDDHKQQLAHNNDKYGKLLYGIIDEAQLKDPKVNIPTLTLNNTSIPDLWFTVKL